MCKTIVIVDDDTLITTTLSTLFEMATNYHIQSFNDPEIALNFIYHKENKVDLVISDFLMPKMNGLEFLKKVQAECPDIINILLTGYADKQNAIRCINELGVYYYLEKPWDNGDLMLVVENGLEKKRLKEALNQKMSELEKSNKALNDWNKHLEKAVAKRTSSLRNLLDNAGQGFMSFGKDLIIDKEYSAECINIFGSQIEYKFFPELIYPNDAKQVEFLNTLLIKILDETNVPKLEIYKSLLPNELILNQRFISFNFKCIEETFGNEKNESDTKEPYISEQHFVVMLTDVTDKRHLEIQMEEEKNTLRMVVKAIVNYSDFVECINDYKYFCGSQIHDILKEHQTPNEMALDIFRCIHTFKGSFGQLDALNTANRLHEFETQLSMIRSHIDQYTISDLRSYVDTLDMLSWLNTDLSTIASYLGNDFFRQKDLLFIDKSKLIEIEKKIISIFHPTEYNLILIDLILTELRNLRYRPFKDLLKTYPEYILNLSDRLEKPINPLIIQGSDIPVDADKYHDFTKSLIHIFRNAIDHGIEPADERLQCGKDYYGNIKCFINLSDHAISLTISDDGHGLDPDTIKAIAVKKGIIDESTADKFSDDDAFDLIFEDGFSTSEHITELSGRGMGLAAVKKELNKLGGTININSIPGKMTEFHFSIPYENN